MKQKKIRYVDIKEINKHLKYCSNFRNIMNGKPIGSIGLNAWVEDLLKWFKLTYRHGADGVCTYVFDKTLGDTTNHQQVTPMVTYTLLCRYAGKKNIPRLIKTKDDAPFSARAFLWYNPKYNETRVEAWAYDVNSSYSAAMIQDMPDTSVPAMSKNVEAGEIGFDLQGNRVTKGFAPFVFKLIPSPFVKFVEVWYDRKRNATTPEEKRKAKEFLNFPIGYLQNVNPFLRAQIIGIANQYIEDLIDENTIYCNTDCIVSIRPRTDLKLGKGLGEFKLEHHGMFAFKGYNYQWDYDTPSIRGKSKCYFPKKWDLLKDDLPIAQNQYQYNEVERRIEKC